MAHGGKSLVSESLELRPHLLGREGDSKKQKRLKVTRPSRKSKKNNKPAQLSEIWRWGKTRKLNLPKTRAIRFNMAK